MEIPPPKKWFVDDQFERKRPVILAKFSNGHLRQSSKIQLKFTSYENSMNKSSHISERILVVNTNRLSYSGRESDTPKITSSVLKVCIHNKKNSSIELYDATLFNLKPLIKCPEIFHSKDTRSFAEKNTDLALEFGSKTKKRSINSKLRHDSSSVNPAAFSSAGITTAGSEEAMSQSKDIYVPTESTASVIPPQNKSATSPDEVYNIWDIISKLEYDALESEAQIFLTAKNEDIQLWKKENRYSPFVIEYLVNSRTSINPHTAKLLAYVHYMLCFLATTYAEWRRKDPVPGVPAPFKERLMDLFTIKKSMPQRMKDKLFSYVMVLGLMLHNYAFDSGSLAFSAKIPGKKLVSVAYALGCHVSENSGKKIIQLKLPLYKYQAVRGPKRSKNF